MHKTNSIKNFISSPSFSLGTLIFLSTSAISFLFFFHDYYQNPLNRESLKYGNEIDSLSNAILNNKIDRVNKSVKSLVKQDDIQYLEVTINGHVISNGGDKRLDDDAIIFIYPIKKEQDKEGQKFGSIEVHIQNKNEQILKSEVSSLLIIELVKVVFYTLVTLLLIRFILSRHLKAISDYLSSNEPLIQKHELVLNRKFEIWKRGEDAFDRLVNSINKTMNSLKGEFVKRSKVEKELDQLVNNINKEVAKKSKLALESYRVNAVARLTSGIMHELNSPLSVIYGAKIHLKKEINKDKIKNERINSSLDMIDEACRRVFLITGALNLLTDSSNKIETVELEKLISELSRSVHEIFRGNIKKLEISTDIEQSKIRINKSIFIQLLFTLIQLRADKLHFLSDSWLKLRVSQKDNKLEVQFTDNARIDSANSELEQGKDRKLIWETMLIMIQKLNGTLQLRSKQNKCSINIHIPIEEENE